MLMKQTGKQCWKLDNDAGNDRAKSDNTIVSSMNVPKFQGSKFGMIGFVKSMGQIEMQVQPATQ